MKIDVDYAAAPNLSMRASADGKTAEIFLYDVIDAGYFGGISAKGFAKQLRELGEVDEITLRINSPGGFITEAMAIHNLLEQHKAKKTVYVDGIAASAASFIMLVGDTIIVPKNAFVMIHNGSNLVWGDRRAMRKEADVLQKMDGTIAAMYAARGNKSIEEFAAMMDEETWFTGDEAKAVGLADRVTAGSKRENRFDLGQFGYRNVPADLCEFDADFAQTARSLFHGLAAACAARTPHSGDPSMSATTPAAATTPTTPAATAVTSPPAGAAQAAAPAAVTPATTPAAAAAPVDVEGIQREAYDKATKRATDITAICQLAGCPEKAAAFISNSAVTPDACRTELFEQMCAKNAAVGADGTKAGGNNSGAADPNAKFKDEYKQNAELHASMGVSEEDYVYSRRVDEGLEKAPALA